MQKFPFALAVGSLMYAQVCMRLDLPFIVGMLGRYLSNPGMDHWRAAKWVMRYLQRTNDYMLTYQKISHLEIIRNSDCNLASCKDTMRSTSCNVYMLVGGVISRRSAKQSLIASSTMATEFIAYFRQPIKEYGYEILSLGCE